MISSTPLASCLPCLTVSIVSHGHGIQVERLVKQVLQDQLITKLILTLNTPEQLSIPRDDRLMILQNPGPKGFGANHNAAFKHCETPYYCVLNPDVVLRDDSFVRLIDCLEQSKAAVAGPLVISATGQQEDSWRRFPTLWTLIMKALGHDITIISQSTQDSPIFPDWIAGMCMVFSASSYRSVQGFDERLFLYYEDVDICARLWKSQQTVVANPRAVVIHNAQRASRRQWRHMRWHLSSMAKYLARYSFKMPRS